MPLATLNVSRDQRASRATILALVLTILAVSFMYALVAINTALELRTRNALDQNRAAAQISARLLDEQWQDILLVIRELTQHSTVEQDVLSKNRDHLAVELKYAVDLVPALMLAAVYTNEGTLISTYPDSPVAPRDASGTAWFEGVRLNRRLYQSDSMRIRLPEQLMTDVIAVAVPLGTRDRPIGYMLALYRVGDTDRWLQDLDLNGSDLYVVNARGLVVDASTGADRHKRFDTFNSFRFAMSHAVGSLISHHFYNNEDAEIGYAYAIRPGWAVIVARPVSQALEPTRALVLRLTLLGLLVLGLLSIGASLIVRLYRTQHRMALALTSQNAKLRETDRIKSDFLANVSHDLRTPLASMQISISSLLEPELEWEPDEVKYNLRVANDSLDQISSRVTNLLEMARIEADIWPVNKQVCDLTDIVGSALERMKTLIAGRELRLNFPESPLLLECDPNQIETVIVNLLENSVKYSSPDGPLSMTGTETPDWVQLRVSDCGTGIPDEDLNHIFEKFYRSRRTAVVGGTGLGLTICKSIIEAHGGNIRARNMTEPCFGRVQHADSSILAVATVTGAEFSFSLPAMGHSAGEADE